MELSDDSPAMGHACFRDSTAPLSREPQIVASEDYGWLDISVRLARIEAQQRALMDAVVDVRRTQLQILEGLKAVTLKPETWISRVWKFLSRRIF